MKTHESDTQDIIFTNTKKNDKENTLAKIPTKQQQVVVAAVASLSLTAATHGQAEEEMWWRLR